MAGNLKLNTVQLGDSATATNNFVLTTNLDGTAKLARGNVGATTQDILTVSAGGVVTLLSPPVVPAQSMVQVNTDNGYGSTNTMIRRYTTIAVNQGTDITYADSATLGASFTINTNGVYSVSVTDVFTGTTGFGISLNSSQLTTAITGITASNVVSETTAPSAGISSSCSATIYIAAGGVIRSHGSGAASTTGHPQQFTITRVA